ncbi:MAG: folate-binding protein YgfZ [Sphingobacteriia bacterium]|nr:folate-binding protein YgfZ [Sphingobacteriia bacterium]
MQLLANRAIITLSGNDKEHFLQGIITKDINKIKSEKIIYTLILNPQGKFLFDLFIFEKDHMLYIDCLKDKKEDLIKKLTVYKLRSDVVIKEEQNIKIYFSNSNLNEENCFIDPRNKNFGFRVYSENESSDSKGFYEEFRVDNAIPEAEFELKYEKSFPLECGLDKLAAIDFNKGCYVGQEVTARTKTRGVIRKALYNIYTNHPIEIGNEIINNNSSIGLVTSFYNNKGIGLIRDDELTSEEVFINNKPVKVKKASWYTD